MGSSTFKSSLALVLSISLGVPRSHSGSPAALRLLFAIVFAPKAPRKRTMPPKKMRQNCSRRKVVDRSILLPQSHTSNENNHVVPLTDELTCH